MSRRRNQEGDRKSAAANDDTESAAAPDANEVEYVFDGPFDAEAAVDALLELNAVFQAADRKWEKAKGKATEAKTERDNASNAIALLIDRIDRHKKGLEDSQPKLKTLPGSASGDVH